MGARGFELASLVSRITEISESASSFGWTNFQARKGRRGGLIVLRYSYFVFHSKSEKSKEFVSGRTEAVGQKNIPLSRGAALNPQINKFRNLRNARI